VSWAVIDSAGRFHGRDTTRRYASASVSKALLLVAALRQVGDARAVPRDLAALLGPLIRVSDNDAAHVVYRRVGGDAAFHAVARAARLRRLGVAGRWSNVQLSAGDVARFFRAADRIVPPRHRAYARRLLERVHPRQSWGVPGPLRAEGWRVLFKGGWRAKLVHQGALVERAGQRIAIAVLTDGNPTHEYGRGTLEGMARRLLTERPLPERVPARRYGQHGGGWTPSATPRPSPSTTPR
jgi:hypothetical protein